MNTYYQELKKQLEEMAQELRELEAEIDYMRKNGISDPGHFDDLCREHDHLYNDEMVPIMDELEELENENS